MTDRVLHCWKDRKEATEETYESEHGAGSFFGSDAWVNTWHDDWKNGTCMLEAGHDGPHDFTDDDDIGVSFVAQEDQTS